MVIEASGRKIHYEDDAVMNERKSYFYHYTQLCRLGLPIMIGQLGVIVLGFADTMMVGHYGTGELAAASFVNNLFNLIIIFATGFSYGLTPIVGQLYGQNRPKEIGRALKNGLWANFSIAVVLTLVMGLVFFNIHRMNQPEELLPLMKPYFLILLSSLVFVLLFNAFKQFADGITDTITSMWILLGGNLINILGNWVLIYGKWGFPELGLMGAGIATLFSRILMVLVFVILFLTLPRYHSYKDGFRSSFFHKEDFMKLNRLGWPVGLQMGMETASFSLSTIMVGWLGTVALATHQVMLTIGQLGFMLYYGMAAAVSVRVSMYQGKGDDSNLKRTTTAGFHLILVLAFAVSVFIFFFRKQMGAWFSNDPAVQLAIIPLVIPYIIYQFGDGLQCNYSNALRGIEEVKPVMMIAFIAYFLISLPAAYLFGFVFKWGLTGIWFSFPLGLTSAGIMYYFQFKSKVKRC